MHKKHHLKTKRLCNITLKHINGRQLNRPSWPCWTCSFATRLYLFQ